MGTKPNGRPPRDLDPIVFEGLCKIHCTKDEICSVFRTDVRVVERWCQRHYQESLDAMYKKFSEGGKSCLRRYQFQLAEKNPTMAIWLGKLWLGQKDPGDETVVKRTLGILEQIKNVRIVDGNTEAPVSRDNTYPIEEAS